MHEHDLYALRTHQSQARSTSNAQPRNKPHSLPCQKQHHALDEDFAAVCYDEGLPFSLFDSCNEGRFHLIKSLVQTKSAPSSTKLIPKWKTKYLNSLPELNVTTDESSDIRGPVLANVTIYTFISSI